MTYKSKLILALGLVYVVWGSTYLGVKYALDVLPPILISCIRFLVGGFVLLTFLLLKHKKLPTKKQIINASFIGILLSGIGNCSVAYAISQMPSGLVALMVATLPAWMIVLDILFFNGKKTSTLANIGLVLGLAGMAYLLNPFTKADIREIALLPSLFILVGSITWAYGSIKSPHLDLPSPLYSTAIQMLAGGVFGGIMSFLVEKNQLQAIQNMTHQTYLAMIYLIFIGSFVGYTAYVWLVNNAPTQLTATYAYVNPVVAIFLGWIFLSEKLTSRSLTASVIILIGVILMTLGRKK
jgi:drug/metabolite transporter (DMT)-like permease